MQEENKKILLNALSKTVKELHHEKSTYLHSLEYGITYSVLYKIEQGKKDPQLTTICQLAYSFNMSLSDFMKKLEKNLPKDFSLFNE